MYMYMEFWACDQSISLLASLLSFNVVVRRWCACIQKIAIWQRSLSNTRVASCAATTSAWWANTGKEHEALIEELDDDDGPEGLVSLEIKCTSIYSENGARMSANSYAGKSIWSVRDGLRQGSKDFGGDRFSGGC